MSTDDRTTQTAITDPPIFFNWWQYRPGSPREDAARKKAAIAAGLVIASGGMLALTPQGQVVREEGIRMSRAAQPRIISNELATM